jgi:NTE family protein
MSGRPKVALVLGSGGVKCASAVGLWKALERAGIDIDLYVGCSGGSFYATGMALGMNAGEAEAHTRVLWEQGLRTRVRFGSVLRLLLPGLFPGGPPLGLLDDRPARRVLQILFGDRTFADLRRPLQLVATDVQTGERVLITEGRLADAVRASVSLPLLFPAWPIGGRLLMDGAATDPLPLSVAIREGADLIIAMGFENPLQERLDSLRAIAAQTSSITMNSLTRSTYAFYSAVHHAEIVPILPTFEGRVSLRDASRVPYLIERGEAAAEEALPHIQRILADLVGAAAPAPGLTATPQR